MIFGKKRVPVDAIEREVMELLLEVSKESHPNEFAGVLRAEGTRITEVMLVPGTVSGDRSALMQLHMLPIDFTVVGTVHSHPTGNPHPSDADRRLFGKFGYVNIITAHPYDMETWRAWDIAGRPYPLSVVD